jgi:hypothetical protein
VFSSNADPFEEGKCYGKFRSLTLLRYGGDFKKAAGYLAENGFGEAREEEPRQASGSGAKPKGSPEPPPKSNGPTPPRRLELTNAADRKMRPTRWLVRDFFPRGAITVIAGDGGFGKSSLSIYLAARFSTGSRCFGLEYTPPPPGRTLLVGCEDGTETTVLPRLAAAEANLELVSLVGDLLTGEDDKTPFTLCPSAIKDLEDAIRQKGDVYCVVIDPVAAFVPDQLDDHKDSHVRRMLRPLADLAERLDIAVVAVKHLSKSDSGNGANLVSGSRAYVNAARAAFLLGPDPTADPGLDRRVLVFAKRNLTRRKRGLAFLSVSLTPYEQDVVLALPQAAGLDDGQRDELREQLFRLEWIGETDVTDGDLARAPRPRPRPDLGQGIQGGGVPAVARRVPGQR